MKGYIQIYTGDGKGKTTAALGLTLRAYGAGLRVFIGQFIKGMAYSELKALPELKDRVTLKQYGRGCFIRQKPSSEDTAAARQGFDECRAMVMNGDYDIVILDELNIALHFKLVSLDDVIALCKNKPDSVELIITGRCMPDELLEIADLVTEMKELKHYYRSGVTARKGIEN